MITERRLIANRANAKVSTGPRTPRGKARASKNALRHGLNLPILADCAQSVAIEDLAQAIAGTTVDRNAMDIARTIAEAYIDLTRIRSARRTLSFQIFSDSSTAGDDTTKTEKIKMLVAIDRYERRAFSRRKNAIRSFDRLQDI